MLGIGTWGWVGGEERDKRAAGEVRAAEKKAFTPARPQPQVALAQLALPRAALGTAPPPGLPPVPATHASCRACARAAAAAAFCSPSAARSARPGWREGRA